MLGGARAGQSRSTSFVNRHNSKQQSSSSMPVFTAHLYPSVRPCSLQPNKAQIEFTQIPKEAAWVAWFHWTSLVWEGEINFHILDGIILHQIPATPNNNNANVTYFRY
jgi:hypothetical protein